MPGHTHTHTHTHTYEYTHEHITHRGTNVLMSESKVSEKIHGHLNSCHLHLLLLFNHEVASNAATP